DGPLEALRGPRSLLQPEPLLPRLGVPGQGRPRRGPLLLLPGVPLSMRPELLPFLACPGCGAALELRPFRGSGFAADEVEEGLLHCRSCGLAYPVTGSIPRLLPGALDRHPRFVREFARELGGLSRPRPEAVRRFDRLHGLTARAFGYEWNTYQTTSREEDVL